MKAPQHRVTNLLIFSVLFLPPPPSNSMFFGNLFVFFQFQGKSHIDEETRTLVFSVLIGVGILGFFFLTALRPIDDTRVVNGNEEADDELDKPASGVIAIFKSSVDLFMTRDMLLLSLTFFYTGKALRKLIMQANKRAFPINY